MPKGQKYGRSPACSARSPRRGADQLWARIDHELADEAPLVPLVNRTWIDFVSKRVGNFRFSWQAGPLLDQFWVRS